MPRARTGSVIHHGDHFDIQITLPNGKRSKRKCQPPEMTEPEARAKALHLTKVAKDRGGVLVVPQRGPETVETWGGRWWEARQAKGMQIESDLARWGKWVLGAPVRGATFGALLMANVSREDVEDVVSFLDAQVRAEKLSWKTAANVWGLVSKAFSDARGAKDRALRARADNPSADVRPPDRGQRKQKQWIHPSELLAAVEKSDEQLELRRAVVLNAYLYMRPGELRALEWSDVDLEAGVVNVHHAVRRDGTEKGTKTDTGRSVPIEPTLLPLLGAMREAAGGTGKVVELPDDEKLADVLRALLKRAGVKRAELFETTSTRKQITWYDLRATGITWRAIRKDAPLEIQEHAGHAHFTTTQVYVRTASAIKNYGAVFPPLPPELYETRAESNRSRIAQGANQVSQSPTKQGVSRWVDGDSNPIIPANSGEISRVDSLAEARIAPGCQTAFTLAAVPTADLVAELKRRRQAARRVRDWVGRVNVGDLDELVGGESNVVDIAAARARRR